MPPSLCTCGETKRKQAGVFQKDGRSTCNNCHLPIEWARAPDRTPIHRPVPVSMVTTLSGLPGYKVVEHLGVVTELTATSGFTATMKGSVALDRAMTNLRESAGQMKATAILGLQSMPFAAGGGITSAFGGDAVGVLLLGTAVVVEPVENGAVA